MPQPPARTLFLVSDGTGITAETLAQALLSQFEDLRVREVHLPFVDSEEKMDRVLERIAAAHARDGVCPIVVATVLDPELRARLSTGEALYLDLLGPFLQRLADALGVTPTGATGRAHGQRDPGRYLRRIDAIHYTLAADDGLALDTLGEADVVLLGVSRVGKTPTSLYLAIHHGLRSANYPLTEEDFTRGDLPPALLARRSRLHGLTIDPERLHEIRERRRPGSDYASLARCRDEVRHAQALFRRHRIPVLDTTRRSIEEIAAAIVYGRAS